jgi:7-dehydrocholesterol reductase
MIRNTVLPVVLMVLTPPVVILVWLTCRYLDGSISRLASEDGISEAIDHFPAPSWTAAAMLAGFVLVQAVFVRMLPGRIHEGPVSPAGSRPRYRANGVASLMVTHLLYFGGSYGLGWFSASVVYDRLGELLITTSLACLVFCCYLYIRGRYAPASADTNATGNAVLDFFHGIELHPSVAGIQLKQLLNCRVGMMGWSLIVVSCAATQYGNIGYLSSGMLVCTVLQLVYVAKFFWWETGYFATLDMMHDRLGYYLAWGVTNWLPAVYTVAPQYLVTKPVDLPAWAADTLLVVGLGAIAVNYQADRQRQRVREGALDAQIWGRPPELIEASYLTADGERRQSLLLVSGWWGVARHFHYVPEFVVALAWTATTGFANALPYLYPLFLAILLLDRVGRDDRRCHAKYRQYWDKYCARVRWKVLPFIY